MEDAEATSHADQCAVDLFGVIAGNKRLISLRVAVATTSTLELQAAWNEVRALANEQAPVPDSPELRIAALSAGEQEALPAGTAGGKSARCCAGGCRTGCTSGRAGCTWRQAI
nr:hypothetical protein [Stenotrophomonas maltophilia]